ncbi:pentapeptide repeat-containing protein [Micromonospora sp. M12]
MTRFVQQADYEGAEFIDLSMASATFREVDLSGARMRGVLLLDADIDGRSTACASTAWRSCH